MGQVERVVETRGEKFGRKEEKVKSGLAKWFFPPTGALQLVQQMKKNLKMSPIRLEKLTQFFVEISFSTSQYFPEAAKEGCII